MSDSTGGAENNSNSALDYFDSAEAQEAGAKTKKHFDLQKFLGYFKGALIVFLIILALAFLAFVSFSTVYVMQKIKFRRIMAQIEGNQGPRAPDYAYTEPIVIRGKSRPPESFVFQVTVVIGYDEKNKDAAAILAAQRSMIQDQIRTYFAENLSGRLTLRKENTMKTDLKEWLNTLLTEDYVQQIFFTDYIVDN